MLIGWAEIIWIVSFEYIKNIFVSKIILHIYIRESLTCIGIFPVLLRMALILIDFPTGSGFQPRKKQNIFSDLIKIKIIF